VSGPHFNRVKVKCPAYVSIHLLHKKNTDEMNAQRLLSVIQSNEGSEFLSYFPQWTNLYHKIKTDYETFCKGAEDCYESLKPIIGDNKLFADQAKNKFPYFSTYLFARKKRQNEFISAKSFFSTVESKRLYQSGPF